MAEDDRSYPCLIDLGGHEVELRLMARADRELIAEWAAELPPDDLMFMRRDITQLDEVDSWIRDIEAGSVVTVLASIEGDLVGYATMHRSALAWSAHVAELRVVVAPTYRKIGIGRALTQEVFKLALIEGIEKMVARMTLDQVGARRTFEELGFRPEALLRDHVKDRGGELHDLIVMSHAVSEFHQMLAAYGVHQSVE